MSEDRFDNVNLNVCEPIESTVKSNSETSVIAPFPLTLETPFNPISSHPTAERYSKVI